MFEKKVFGSRVKELRQVKGITLQELGNILSSSKSVMSNIELGKKGVSVEILIALARYFNVSIDYLVGESDDPARR